MAYLVFLVVLICLRWDMFGPMGVVISNLAIALMTIWLLFMLCLIPVGNHLEKKRKIAESQLRGRIIKLRNQNRSYQQIAKIVGCSPSHVENVIWGTAGRL